MTDIEKKRQEMREDAIVITKDQLWREGIHDEQRLAVGAMQIVDGIFSRLDSQGGVIKVDKPLPRNDWSEDSELQRGWRIALKAVKQANFVGYERLVEPLKEGGR